MGKAPNLEPSHSEELPATTEDVQHGTPSHSSEELLAITKNSVIMAEAPTGLTYSI